MGRGRVVIEQRGQKAALHTARRHTGALPHSLFARTSGPMVRASTTNNNNVCAQGRAYLICACSPRTGGATGPCHCPRTPMGEVVRVSVPALEQGRWPRPLVVMHDARRHDLRRTCKMQRKIKTLLCLVCLLCAPAAPQWRPETTSRAASAPPTT